MNCPSRTDDLAENDGYNQSPHALSGDATTRQDMNGIANLRIQRDHLPQEDDILERIPAVAQDREGRKGCKVQSKGALQNSMASVPSSSLSTPSIPSSPPKTAFHRACLTFLNFTKFIGPGFLVAVAYIDPGNYATDVSAGAETKFQLLFIVLMSNIFAIVLQSLAMRLGTVTGMNLAEHCRAHLPMWLNIALYIMAEAAIIATDIAEVSHGLSGRQQRNSVLTGHRLLAQLLH
jgi:metal iron transporter